MELAGLEWEPHAGKVLRAALPKTAAGPLQFATLLDGGSGRRLIRARTPNGNPEDASGLCFMGSALLPGEGCAAYIRSAGGAGEKITGRPSLFHFPSLFIFRVFPFSWPASHHVLGVSEPVLNSSIHG